jgi:hypothetical protein
LKHKDETVQAVKNHVTYLRACGMQLTAFQCDQGAEFINKEFIQQPKQQGIKTTVPYPPSQNGAAKHLNHTLVELERAMMIGMNVPAFPWEYLRECAPTKVLADKTPYEAWYGNKPDVSSLQEFGSPVYVLLQGQKDPAKLQPRSKQQIFDDGTK